MADDVDPTQSLTGDARVSAGFVAAGDQGAARESETVDVATVEHEPVEFDAGANHAAPAEPAQDPLPTMADLDRVASELDDIDIRLAALDEQRS